MKTPLFSLIRDILLLCTLALLVRTAYNRTAFFINIHRESSIHELDMHFIDQLYTAQRQLHALENYYENSNASNTHKQHLKNNLVLIALLGPLGTTAIVLKEKELEKKLLKTVTELNHLLHSLNESNQHDSSASTITLALQENKQLIKQLLS